jgi:hypothetical protein
VSTLRTALEIGLERALVREHVIPPMTHPLSSAWHQPPRRDIEIDDKYAMMSRRTFEALHEYSCSLPSGVYEGKMWRRGEPYIEPRSVWYLGWFGCSDKPDKVSINWREIIIVEESR